MRAHGQTSARTFCPHHHETQRLFACLFGMSKVFDLSLSAHKMCKFDPVVFAPSHCYGMWCPALPSMSVVLECAVSAPLLLLALSAPVFRWLWSCSLIHVAVDCVWCSGALSCWMARLLQPGLVWWVWPRCRFLGFFFLEKALVGRFMVCSPLAALLVASLVAIVGPAHEFSCAGFAHCFQFVVLLLDAAMLELRVRVGAFLVVHELLIFLLAGRT